MFQVGVPGPRVSTVRVPKQMLQKPKVSKPKVSVSKPKKTIKPKAIKTKVSCIVHRKKTANSAMDIYDKFKPYIGQRWHIPSGIKVSPSVFSKFHFFDRHPIDTALAHIGLFIKNPCKQLLPPANPYYAIEWKPPKCVLSVIQSNTDLQRNEYKKVKLIYEKIRKCNRYLKKLVYNWRVQKCIRNIKNTVDTVTLEPPREPVYVIDYKQRTSYVYEASSLKRTIEHRLLLSDYMFPEPQEPVNTLSNTEFTYGQLVSIHQQCRGYGEYSWMLDRYIACECELSTFEMRFNQELHHQAIITFFKGPLTNVAKDMVIDLFDKYAYSSQLSAVAISEFARLVHSMKIHSYAEKWIKVTRRYYLATNMKDFIELARLQLEIRKLILQGERVLESI